MMQIEDAPQLPLTPRKRLLVGVGLAMFAAQVAGAVALAPPTTGEGDARAVVIAALWAASFAWSVVVTLLIVRQADRADIATAAFVVTIASHATFVFAAAVDARGGPAAVDLVDALFFGVTVGALTALPVWGIAEVAARRLRLPTSGAQRVR